MCTMTIVPKDWNHVRIGFNRDEQRSRKLALPPELRTFGTRQALLPIDPLSGGTWLAANDAGLILAILNVNPETPSQTVQAPRFSRGSIIPQLLPLDSPTEVLNRLEPMIQPGMYAPFRFVLVGNGIIMDVHWDGQQKMVMNRLLGTRPILFTSSGLGDHVVEPVRRRLFESMFATSQADWFDVQQAFHFHQWPHQEHLSVYMSRSDAKTVSHSLIDRQECQIDFFYSFDALDTTMPIQRSLQLQSTGGAP